MLFYVEQWKQGKISLTEMVKGEMSCWGDAKWLKDVLSNDRDISDQDYIKIAEKLTKIERQMSLDNFLKRRAR